MILAAGAYFSPSILVRSGIGPKSELAQLDIPVAAALPVGDRLLDHYGTDVCWKPSIRLDSETAAHEREHALFQPHVVLKAASSRCEPGSWDLHMLTWLGNAESTGRYEAYALVFHMKPLSTGTVRVRSTDPREAPVVERGYLSRDEDLTTLLDGIDVARRLAATAPLRELLAEEIHPGQTDPFHPVGTCALGEVVDSDCRVFGIEGLVVADASIMPTIPRANTNLTTAAIAERVASGFD